MKMTMEAYERLSSTPSGARALAVSSLRRRVLATLERAVESSGLAQAEIARRLGIRKSAVHRSLNGNGNLQVDTIAQLLHECGFELSIRLVENGEIRSAMIESREERCVESVLRSPFERVSQWRKAPIEYVIDRALREASVDPEASAIARDFSYSTSTFQTIIEASRSIQANVDSDDGLRVYGVKAVSYAK